LAGFGGFISFIGSTCCSLLAFILPASFYLRLFPAEPPSLRARLHKLLLYTMILLGVAALVVGVYEAAASAMD
jgi:proton-coupled amino acid transporter